MIDTLTEAISNMSTFSIVLWIALILWGIWELVQYYRRKNAATALENEDFKENMRKVQLIDVRDRDEYNAGHILGARNIPIYEMRQRHVELRKDTPIYLYGDGSYGAYRAALELKKYGFEDLYVLKDGYKNWEGRIKRNKTVDD